MSTSRQAVVRTLAAMAALGEGSTSQVCAYAGVRADLAQSILRADPDLIAEAVADESGETVWRVRDRDQLRARTHGIRPGPEVDPGSVAGLASVMPSDLAVAEQLCLNLGTTASDEVRVTVARTALQLVRRLQPHVEVKDWRARLTMLAPPVEAAGKDTDVPDEVDAIVLRRRAGLVAVLATIVQAEARGSEMGEPELEAALRTLSAHTGLHASPVHRALADLLDQIATRAADAASSDLVRRIRQTGRDGPPAVSGPKPAPSADARLLSLLEAYFSAPTWPESQRLVEQHPELLSEDAEAAVQHVRSAILERGELRMAAELERQMRPLRRARVVGAPAAFAEMGGGDGLDELVMEFVSAPTWAESREILRRHPQLLEDVVLEGIAFLIELAATNGDHGAAAHLTEHLNVLRRCREIGADAAFAELAGPDSRQAKMGTSQPDDLLPTLLEFLESGTLAQMQRFAAQHPVLLGPEADAVLTSWARQANEEGRAETAFKLIACQQMLARLRSGGGDDAEPDDAVSDDAYKPDPIPAELGPLVRRITQLDGEDEIEERAGLLRQVIAATESDIHADLWVSMQSMLGATLGDLAERDRSPDHYEGAIAALEAAQSVLERMPDVAVMSAVNHDNLGAFYSRRAAGHLAGNMDRAIGHLVAALSPPDVLPAHLRPAALCRLAGLLLDRNGERRAQDVEDAIAYTDEAIMLIDRGRSPAEWARASRLLGGAHLLRLSGSRRENLTLALRHLHAAASEVDADSDPAEWVLIQSSLGSAYREGAIDSAEESMERAVRHFRDAVEVAERRLEPMRLAGALNGLGTAYLDRVAGDPDENVERAIECLARAMEICRGSALVGESALVARNLAAAYLKRDRDVIDDNIATAVSLLENAVAICAGRDAPYERAATSLTLGNALLGWGRGARARNAEDAIAAFTESAEVFGRIGAPREAAMSRLNLANAHVRAFGDEPGHIASAIWCLQLALTEFEAQGLLVEQAQTLDALGQAWSKRRSGADRSAADTAIRYHTTAIQVLGTPTVSPSTWAAIQSNLGSAYLERHGDGDDREGDLDRAIACLESALAVGAGQRLGPTGGLAMTRTNLGIAYAERGHLGDLAAAIGQLEASFETIVAAGVPVQRRISGKALGDAYSQTGRDWANAARAYGEALDAGEVLYTSALLRTEREAELIESADLHIRAAYAAGMAGDPEQAAVWLEQGRARSLGESMARDRAQLDEIRSHHGPIADEFAAAALLVSEIDAEEWGTQRSDSVRWRRVQQARQRLERAIGAIRGIPEHATFLRQPEAADIVAVAADAGAIAYLAVAPRGSLTLLVTGDPGVPLPTVRLVPPPAEPLTTTRLRAALIQTESGRVHRGYLPELVERDAAGLTRELDELLPFLGERLVHPLAEAVQQRGERRVTIVACGLLGLIPLHAASYQRNGKPSTLLDDVDVSFAPSARVLAAARSWVSRPAASPEPTLVGVGDPAGPQRLPYAEIETRNLSRLFERQRTFFGSEATKDALLSAAPGATHIHLACHGTFSPNAPLDSALLLAGSTEYESLTLREILTQRPFRDARLVVASACRTAVIDFLDLPDEAVGLPAGVLRAGTPGVIGTLWAVEDVSTALLMIRFYECLFGADGRGPLHPAAALRSAQCWLSQLTVAERDAIIGPYGRSHRDVVAAKHGSVAPPWQQVADGPDGRPYAHPYFWAAFVFVGA